MFKTKLFKMSILGEKIRKLREEKGLPLRKVAAFLDTDQAILSKIERGLRNISREQVVNLALFFQVEEKDLLVSWLSDKLLHELGDEDLALQALQLAEERMTYQVLSKEAISSLISTIKSILKKDGRVTAAWLFGSMSTLEAKSKSDLDLIVELKENEKYSMFDLLDIAHAIEIKINRKVDLVEKGQLKDFAMETATQNLQQIYG
jgi:predicted nucleotidyltransferase